MATEKKPFLTTESVRNAVPIIDAALVVLSTVPQLRPYVVALRTITAVGQYSVPDQRAPLIENLHMAYKKLRDAELADEEFETREAQIRFNLALSQLFKTLE